MKKTLLLCLLGVVTVTGCAPKEDKMKTARADVLKEIWERQAVMGLPPEGQPKYTKKTRRVYVPSREINGVVYPGGYQTVEVQWPPQEVVD